jgi:hypothetical protein
MRINHSRNYEWKITNRVTVGRELVRNQRELHLEALDRPRQHRRVASLELRLQQLVDLEHPPQHLADLEVLDLRLPLKEVLRLHQGGSVDSGLRHLHLHQEVLEPPHQHLVDMARRPLVVVLAAAAAASTRHPNNQR